MKNYDDVTFFWVISATPNSHDVLDLSYFMHDGIKYKVDNKNVVLDYSLKELEVANWLENTFGGEIYMLPRINKPDGIQTADYLFRGEYWDLKEIVGCGKRVFEDSIKDKRKQSHNFIFEISQSCLEINNILFQVGKIFSSKSTNFVDKIIVKSKKKLIVVYKRKAATLRVTTNQM